MPSAPAPAPQHQWLMQLVGDWEYRMEHVAAPEGTTEEEAASYQHIVGRDSVRALGGVWTVSEMTVVTPGHETDHSMMTLGYDPARGRFTGTFVGAMMTELWVYDGELTPDGRTLLLHTEGPSFTTPGARSRYRDSMEMVSADERVMQSRYDDGNGGWTLFMSMRFTRMRGG